MMQQYIYGPIDPFKEVRLLELYAGQNDETLEGELVPQLLDKANLFCTLSYVWGCDHKPYQIETPDGYIPLTESLHEALVAIRDPQRRILIWADAICIDQQDLAEKGVQVSIMRDIYAQSSETIVYLGSSSPEIELAMQATRYKYDTFAGEKANVQSRIKRKRIEPSVDVSEELLWIITPDETILQPGVEFGIKALFAKDWFSRRWVVQEVVVSRQGDPVYVHCGKQCIEWNVLVEGLVVILSDCVPHTLHTVENETEKLAPDLRKKKTDLLECYQTIGCINALQMDYRSGKLEAFCTLLKKLNQTYCEREHDLILSLFGISSIRDVMKLDWKTVYSYDVRALCLAAAFAVIETEGLGSLLQMTRYSPDCPSRLSWIPNIDQKFVPTTVFYGRYTCDIYRNAPNSQASQTPSDGNSCYLPLTVYVIDIVQQALPFNFNAPGGALDYGQVSSYIEQVLLVFQDAVFASTAPEDRGEAATHLCAIVLVAGWCWSNLWSPSRQEAIREIWLGFVNFSSLILSIHLSEMGDAESRRLLGEMTSTKTESLSVGLEYMANLSRVENMGLGTVCLTKRRYACNMPKTTSAGDLLVVIPGVGVPVVLHKCEQIPHSYRYLGPAFVAGLMNGEAMSLEGIEVRELTIH